MQDIEPFYNWRHLYSCEEDDRSPFYGRVYSEFEYSNTVYNYYIHPQWDEIGSPTLYIKIIYCDYDQEFAIIEFLGEWNDAIYNDIMTLKRDIIDELINQGIKKFILIGENVLNFHASDDCYYQEWLDDIDEGWIVALNFREHVLSEFKNVGIDYYITYGGEFNDTAWRTFSPTQLLNYVEAIINKRLN
ncbi:MAG: hypothetical protein ACKOX3_01455 [Bacteroidota bacterium]